MAELSAKTAVLVLAERAAGLPSKLEACQKGCSHAGGDIKDVECEVTLIGKTLKHLHEAMIEDPDLYTASFTEDLAEISTELGLIFDEVVSCCRALSKSDPASGSEVSWFFRKPKIHHLLRHLQALKSTLVVMRTVLQHGREYGNEKNANLEVSQPALHGDRAILDSVLSANRNAIIKLHDSTQDRKSDEGKKDDSGGLENGLSGNDASDAGDRVRQGSAATVEAGPCRSFCRRGVRLGVHMAILDMGAHSAPDALKDKWVRISRAHPPGRQMRAASSDMDHSEALRDISNKARTMDKEHDSKGADGKSTAEKEIPSSFIADKLHKMLGRLGLS